MTTKLYRAKYVVLVAMFWFSVHAPYAAESSALALEIKIPLGNVNGRVDHMAIDVSRQRLFVAELGNDTFGIVDLKHRKTIQTIGTSGEPHGIAYAPASDMIYVASGHGSLNLYQGTDFSPAGKISIGEDADNLRVDTTANRLWVGYESGALAAIDLSTQKIVGNILLKNHPEGFQLSGEDQRIFVNVPDAHEIAVVDRDTKKQIASWPTKNLRSNFPMALDVAAKTLLTVFRKPSMLVATSTESGVVMSTIETCGDADDVFIDGRRNRVYVICGEGLINIFESKGGTYSRIGRVSTATGARTGLWAPELDRLLVAVRRTSNEPAAIWVFQVQSQH